MVDGSDRRRFLGYGVSATALALSGCTGVLSNDVSDTDGDGIIDSEDYAPRDANVQSESDVKVIDGEETTTEETTTDETATEETTADETSTTAGGELVADDFDYHASDLDDHGWSYVKAGNSIEVVDSRLSATRHVDGGAIVAHAQPSATGTFRFEGIRNAETFYGMRIDFISAGSSRGEAGYRLTFQQARDSSVNGDRNNILFTRLGSDEHEHLLKLVDQHDGQPYDVAISRPSVDAGFTFSVNGQEVGTVADATYTSSTTMFVQFGGRKQYVDAIKVR